MEKLVMHAGQFSLGMKFTQHCLHQIDLDEPLSVNEFETRPYMPIRD